MHKLDVPFIIDQTQDQEDKEKNLVGRVNVSFDDSNKILTYTFCIDRLKIGEEYKRLIPHSYNEKWPHHEVVYIEWFDRGDSLEKVCNSMDVDVDGLRKLFCSNDPEDRLFAYSQIGEYWGWDNLDSYPDVWYLDG